MIDSFYWSPEVDELLTRLTFISPSPHSAWICNWYCLLWAFTEVSSRFHTRLYLIYLNIYYYYYYIVTDDISPNLPRCHCSLVTLPHTTTTLIEDFRHICISTPILNCKNVKSSMSKAWWCKILRSPLYDFNVRLVILLRLYHFH